MRLFFKLEDPGSIPRTHVCSQTSRASDTNTREPETRASLELTGLTSLTYVVSATPVRDVASKNETHDLWFPTCMCAHVYLHPFEHTCAHMHLNKKAQITGSEVAERWLVAMEMLGSRYQVLPCPSEPVFTFQNRGLSDVT